jgi:hypothetical protein
MDDLKETAKSQLKRLAHLQGFPKHTEAIADYISALCVAKIPDRVKAVVDAFVTDTETTQCPTAAMIRRVAYDKTEADTERQRDCLFCGGAGFTTNWYLVTYIGKSFTMKKSEKLTSNYEEAMAFARKIAAQPLGNDNQDVISAAKECVCRKAA